MTIQFYGIPNCDTVKKARKWLEAHGKDMVFHDLKKEGADPDKLQEWSSAVGWEALLNKRGTTFRKLSDADKTDIDQSKAIVLMSAHPSMVKRPVIEHDGKILVGFKEEQWQSELS